jgi:hypothetical protein
MAAEVEPVLLFLVESPEFQKLTALMELLPYAHPERIDQLLVLVEQQKDKVMEESLSLSCSIDVGALGSSFRSWSMCKTMIDMEELHLAEQQMKLEEFRFLASIASECSEESETGAVQAVEALKKLQYPRSEIERVSVNLEEYNLELMRLRDIFIEELIAKVRMI